MGFDSLRVYAAGRLSDMAPPDWYHEAERLSRDAGLTWHQAVSRVLGCCGEPLTEDGSEGGWIEVRFWPSVSLGTFVLIDTEAGIIEQVLVPNPVDWLPFLTQHITPLISSAAQAASSAQQRKLARAFIALARHGAGSHVDRETGLSRIDLDNDYERQLIERARAARARNMNGGVA